MQEKDLFVSSIKSIIEQNKREDKLMESLDMFIDGHSVPNFAGLVTNKLIDILSFYMDDTDDYIRWWLYESVEKYSIYDGKKYFLTTPSDLFDFMRTIQLDKENDYFPEGTNPTMDIYNENDYKEFSKSES